MSHSAFQLNTEFLSEVCKKIHALKLHYAHEKGLIKLFVNSFDVLHVSLAKIIDAAYWASLTTEEGHQVRFSLVIKDYEQSSNIFCFEKPITLNLKNLVKLGSALNEGLFSDICINQDKTGSLKIWGLRRRSLNHLTTSLWIQVLGPGNLIIICYGKSIAAVKGDQAVFVDPTSLYKTILPKIALSCEGHMTDSMKFLRVDTLLYIAQAMRAHQRGGTLLVVPKGNSWKKSIRHPVAYMSGPSFVEPESDSIEIGSFQPTARDLLNHFQKAETEQAQSLMKKRTQLIQQCNSIGSLTAIDGALVMTYDCSIHCFGAKIHTIEMQPNSTEVRVLKPIKNDQGRKITFADLGGTRHFSAAQFAYDQPDAIAIVASQDGNVTFFTKDVISNELLVVQQAELALVYGGIGGDMWIISQFIDQ